ncbi:hypothetical protein GGS23DRAFT_586183 [Durotheca rogersii]|uniref:uncharacterized protein n=1 Tax=Durotheca rogersii TaxID=419775 RepID=UPI00221F5759|nr:uncharacterized protein GGS23DRAFT_586183 [Durotheca rogersii]KAI5859380.1 hypothetical protein GGS23DRAFT_586183 [Durotheca rogersii]
MVDSPTKTIMASEVDNSGGALDGDLSPADKDVGGSLTAPVVPSLDSPDKGLASFNMRADPDAQATVTDFLDFTEYLPSDMVRSLTLIGKLDQAYSDASTNINDLTTTWGKLPSLPVDGRPSSVQLRADISESLNRAVSSRIFSHAEAVRMYENVTRHYHRIQTILSKLQTMRDNYPSTDEQKSPIQVKSPQMVRGPKLPLRLDNNGQKIRGPPRITVPGEVLAPYEMDFNTYSSFSDVSSDHGDEDEVEEAEEEAGLEEERHVSPKRVVTPSTRIKVVKPLKTPKNKTPKPPRPPRSANRSSDNPTPMISTSTALAQLKPPPENAVPGSTDAPWLQLTPYELAKLRKRMKKNAVWNPSDTMIARELKNLGRGVEAYRAAQKQAEEEGKPFDAALPAPVVDAESGTQHPPEGAISAEALTADEVQLSNRGMKLNEAKKLKRETLARMAAEEAEESARKMAEAARMFFTHEASPSVAGSVPDKAPEPSQTQSQGQGQSQSQKSVPSKPKTKKRKRESMSETPSMGRPEVAESLANASASQPPTQVEKPPTKRNKTETPVPLPQLTPRPPSVPPVPGAPPAAGTTAAPATETPVPVPHLGKTSQVSITSKTPVPVPVPVSSDGSMVATKSAASSGATSPTPPSSITTTIPIKPPAEAPVLHPVKTSTTPIPPPVREIPKRETRQNLQSSATANPKQTNSRGNTPAGTPAPESQPAASRRPSSRGQAASQEPPSTLATERSRRTSTARNTPVPELRQASKRAKRPAPGVVTTNSGGTSAVGKRKAAPRKKTRNSNPRKEKGTSQQPEPEVEVEVDDDGNVIDPEEPRYCLCNRVSFGTMIQCDNVDVSARETSVTPACEDDKTRNKRLTAPRVQNCKQEWFHLECVELSEIPARTTKWYCPDCRVLLNIGGRGEVNSRGVKL